MVERKGHRGVMMACAPRVPLALTGLAVRVPRISLVSELRERHGIYRTTQAIVRVPSEMRFDQETLLASKRPCVSVSCDRCSPSLRGLSWSMLCDCQTDVYFETIQ